MHSLNKDIGSLGESIAISYLQNNQYKILCKNFRTRKGEIDIICFKNSLIIFIEVKSRYTDSFGSPIESVTCFKQKRILNLSKIYINTKKLFNFNTRYDVIEITFNHNNDNYIINHIKDAFRGY